MTETDKTPWFREPKEKLDNIAEFLLRLRDEHILRNDSAFLKAGTTVVLAQISPDSIPGYHEKLYGSGEETQNEETKNETLQTD